MVTNLSIYSSCIKLLCETKTKNDKCDYSGGIRDYVKMCCWQTLIYARKNVKNQMRLTFWIDMSMYTQYYLQNQMIHRFMILLHVHPKSHDVGTLIITHILQHGTEKSHYDYSCIVA